MFPGGSALHKPRSSSSQPNLSSRRKPRARNSQDGILRTTQPLYNHSNTVNYELKGLITAFVEFILTQDMRVFETVLSCSTYHFNPIDPLVCLEILCGCTFMFDNISYVSCLSKISIGIIEILYIYT